MTSPSWTGRVLGKSIIFTAQNNTLLFFTGNNCSVGADIQERVLICDLYVETADRQDRSQEIADEDLRDEVWLADPTHRRRILSALWCVVRHWDARGRPLATGKPRRGFETWSRIFGGMVELAGFGDPLARPLDLDNCGDSETDDFAELVRIAAGNLSNCDLTFQEVVHTLWEHGLLPWLFHGREDYDEGLSKVTFKLNESSASKMGLLLNRNCSGERGSIFTVKSPDGSLRRVRAYRKGKGRHRRFHFDTVIKQ